MAPMQQHLPLASAPTPTDRLLLQIEPDLLEPPLIAPTPGDNATLHPIAHSATSAARPDTDTLNAAQDYKQIGPTTPIILPDPTTIIDDPTQEDQFLPGHPSKDTITITTIKDAATTDLAST